jgi:hypothetical protein
MPTIEHADERLALAFDGPLLISVLRKPLTVDGARAVHRAAQRAFDLYKGKAGSLTIIEPTASGSPPPEVREITTAMSRQFPLVGAAIIVEGSGFGAATTRTVIAGVYLLSKKNYPHKICSTVGEGATWLAALLPGPSAQTIAAAGEAARAALRSGS